MKLSMGMRTNIKTLAAFIFCVAGWLNISAQITMINNHTGERNKKDLNQAYINAKTSAIKTLNNSYFEDGYVFGGSDTIKCKIYVPKHKLSDELYIYIIARMPNDSIYVYSPKDISGYNVKGATMRAHRSALSGDTNYFFIRLIEKGRITLYDRACIPSDKEYLYYFERPNESYLMFLAPYKQTDHYMVEGYYGSGGGGGAESPMLSKYSVVDETLLKTALSEYLKDCESVCHKIASNFYSISDIPSIIRDYNKCGK